MIDTMKLALDTTMFALIDEARFEKHKDIVGRGYFSLLQNPTAGEMRRGIYKPRLTLAHRFNHKGEPAKILTVESSLTKLIFGNNFDELTGNEFSKVAETLCSTLRGMGVRIFDALLPNAPASAVHYAKNLPLTDYTTPRTYIEKFSRANVSQRADTNQTDFRNAGQSFKYHTNSFEFAMYDKISDLKQAKISEKRAEEKDNAIQLHLLDDFAKKRPFEVIRVESRLNQRWKIKQMLKKIGKEGVEPTFKNLFDREISQRILLNNLKELEDSYPPVLALKKQNFTDSFTGLLISNPDKKPEQLVEMVGLMALFEEVGVRGFREATKRYGNQFWYKENGKMKSLNKPKEVEVFQTLRKQLEEFKPLRLVDFQGKDVK